MINKSQAEEVIARLAQRNQSTSVFDSHEFIDLYRANYEHDYISMLLENDSNLNNTAFQSANSQIAKYLSVNSSELNIEKIDTSDSMNDHGNKTSNAKWRLLSNTIKSLIVFFICGLSSLFSYDCYANEELDMPSFKSMTMYTVDTTYIRKDIVLLKDFLNKGCSKKNPLYNKLRDLYGYSSYKGYGISVHPVKKSDVKSSAELWVNEMQEIINKTKDGVEVSPNEFETNKRQECQDYYNSDNLIDPFLCIRIRYRGEYGYRFIGYKFPLINFIKKQPISWNELSDKEKKEIYEKDKMNLIKGYEWITTESGKYINDEAKKIKKSYPVETTYYVFDHHPEFAIKLYIGNEYNFDTYNYVWSIYNLKGELVRIHGFEDNMEDEIKIAENLACWNDYKTNKYNITSEDSLTKQYVEMILSGEMEKLQNEYLGKMLGMAFAGAVATELSSSYSEQRDIRNKVLKESIKTSNDVIQSIDKDNMQKARGYVNQLKSDHYGEFNRGRCIRIDDKSFYLSLVDKTGKANRIFKIVYIQNGPFESKKNVSIVEQL